MKLGVLLKLYIVTTTALATIEITAAAVVTLTLLALQIPAITITTTTVAEIKIAAATTTISMCPIFKHSIRRRDHAIEQGSKIRTRKQTRSAGNS